MDTDHAPDEPDEALDELDEDELERELDDDERGAEEDAAGVELAADGLTDEVSPVSTLGMVVVALLGLNLLGNLVAGISNYLQLTLLRELDAGST